jgi:dCMP deaminase
VRISRDQAFMETARVFSKRSTCFRLNVGCVIVVNRRIISVGYNGAPPGLKHCGGNSCPGMQPGGCPTSHAEANALDYVPMEHTLSEKDLYVTDSPCPGCAKRIADSYVERVFFERAYRDLSGVAYLLNHGVSVYEVKPAGYILDHSTGRFFE